MLEFRADWRAVALPGLAERYPLVSVTDLTALISRSTIELLVQVKVFGGEARIELSEVVTAERLRIRC